MESKTTNGLCLHTLQYIRHKLLNHIEKLTDSGRFALESDAIRVLYGVSGIIHAEIAREEGALDEYFKEMYEAADQ